MALEMIDELRSWGIEPPVILADGGYGDITEFRQGLEDRGLSYVVDVKGGTSAYREDVVPEQPAWKGTGRPPKPRYREDRSSLKALALAAGKKATVTVTWWEGTRGKMTSRFLALRVRPANLQLRNNANRNGEELPLVRPDRRPAACRPGRDGRASSATWMDALGVLDAATFLHG